MQIKVIRDNIVKICTGFNFFVSVTPEIHPPHRNSMEDIYSNVFLSHSLAESSQEIFKLHRFQLLVQLPHPSDLAKAMFFI
jgi:hypothetical protein